MKEQPPGKHEWARQTGMLTMIPILLGVAPMVGYFMGKWLDGWLNTGPVLTLVFLGLGFVAGIRETIFIIRRANREANEDE